jgi:hypothetical protein
METGGGSGSGGDAGASGGAGDAGGSGAGGGPPLPPELTWTRVADLGSSSYEGVWGTTADNVYAVGSSGQLMHFSGTWAAEATGTTSLLTSIWGSGASDVHVSVNANVILQSSGTPTWQRETFDQGVTFKDVWGIETEHVYAVARGALFHRANGGSWESESIAAASTVAIWGSSATDLYVVADTALGDNIFHSSGDGSWQPQANTGGYLYDVWGTGSTRIYAAGSDGVFVSNGGGTWTRELDAIGDAVRAVWALSPDEVYACGANTFYRSNGAGTWSAPQTIADLPLLGCQAIWGTGPDNMYLGTTSGVFHGTL